MATGIIAEYNPFHNGHLYMLNQIREQLPHEPIIICLSGSITQRGEIALLDKWTRARSAILAGANLVLELPAVFACRSAQAFGAGGIKLLSALNIVDHIAFGTEYPDLSKLNRAAGFIPDHHSDELHALLQNGLSYGAAVTRLMSKNLSLPEKMLYEPNTILALEYLRCLKSLRDSSFPSPAPLPIRRTGAAHRELLPKGSFASGTALRQLVHAAADKEALHMAIGHLVPTFVAEAVLQCHSYPEQAKIYQLLKYKLFISSPENLQQIYGMGEGLEQAMRQAINSTDYKSFVQTLTSRRYPAARIQRLIIHILLSMNKESIHAMDKAGPLYARVLGMDDTGRQILRQIKNRGRLPLLNKISVMLNRRDLLHPQNFTLAQHMLSIDVAATNLRNLTLSQTAPFYEDYLRTPCYIPTQNQPE